MKNTSLNLSFIIGITAVSAMGGLLFGYDWVVIGGAKPFYERFFDITTSPYSQGWAMSSALIGCLVGAVSSGLLADRYGRRGLLLLASVLFTISAIGTGSVNDFSLFVAFRLLGGLGIGLASAISPMYIAEIAPAHLRGRLVSVNQLTIVIGILGAQIVNFLIAQPVDPLADDVAILQSWNGQMGWRWMFWAETVPAMLFFLLVFFIPESPRFLIKAGRSDKAVSILGRIGGAAYAAAEKEEIETTLNDHVGKAGLRDLIDKRVLPVVLIGVVLAVFQQWCGINVVFNYAEEVFVAAGFTVSDMLFNIVITGTVNLVFTLVAMRVVDSLGRRKLMLFGSIGLACVYFLLGGSYLLKLDGMVVLVLVLLGIATYAMTLAPITWVVLSEIFPNRLRGAAMAVATTALWAASFLLTYTLPLLNKALQAGGTFWLYALICLAGFFFIWKKLPETKGKSLEEIERELTK